MKLAWQPPIPIRHRAVPLRQPRQPDASTTRSSGAGGRSSTISAWSPTSAAAPSSRRRRMQGTTAWAMRKMAAAGSTTASVPPSFCSPSRRRLSASPPASKHSEPATAAADVGDEYDDTGWSAMVAGKRDWGQFTGLVELLRVSSRRENREDVGTRSAPAPDSAPGRSANALVTTSAAGRLPFLFKPRAHGAWTSGFRGRDCPVRAACCGAADGPRRRCVGPAGARCGRHALPVGSAARAPRAGGHYVVSQQNLQFHPFLSIVPVGADVVLPQPR